MLAVAVAPWAGAQRLATWVARASLAERALVLVLVLVAGAPWLIRAVSALANTVHATTNIHDQQVQMGRFLARHYAGRAVAVNDIGAVCYFADLRLCDLWGLGSAEIARLAPNLQIQKDWRGPTHLAESIRTVTEFLTRHTPAS